jgi:pantoate--beta-alanine ligase
MVKSQHKKPDRMETVRTVEALRARIKGWRKNNETIGLVPTMGALHAGHLALVRESMKLCARTVVTIFVNPSQFGADEDLVAYPRTEADDARKLATLGVDLLFAPSQDEMYPPGSATSVTVSGLTEGLCGASRPVHFGGVALVVTKLLIQALPDAAFFGEKDYQQLLVIRRLVRDLFLPVQVIGVPTVREADGLACSSRNAYLTPQERQAAPALHRILRTMAERLSNGEWGGSEAKAWGRRELEAAGFRQIDYAEICDAETLEPVATVTRPARVLAAARLGQTRLIDNWPVGPATKPA